MEFGKWGRREEAIQLQQDDLLLLWAIELVLEFGNDEF
jgi:hypothetical protein